VRPREYCRRKQYNFYHKNSLAEKQALIAPKRLALEQSLFKGFNLSRKKVKNKKIM